MSIKINSIRSKANAKKIDIRQQLIQIRREKGHNRKEAAEISGMSIDELKGIELWGERPNSENLIKIINYYDLSPELVDKLCFTPQAL